MKFLHLIYHSRAISGLTQSELSKILATSRRNNLINGVTGFLIYRDNYFLQLLEGTEEAVATTMDRVKKDSRHFAVTVIGEYQSVDRMVPAWSMALVDPAKMKNTAESLIDLFDLARGKRVFSSKESLEIVLKKFSSDSSLFIE